MLGFEPSWSADCLPSLIELLLQPLDRSHVAFSIHLHVAVILFQAASLADVALNPSEDEFAAELLDLLGVLDAEHCVRDTLQTFRRDFLSADFALPHPLFPLARVFDLFYPHSLRLLPRRLVREQRRCFSAFFQSGRPGLNRRSPAPQAGG